MSHVIDTVVVEGLLDYKSHRSQVGTLTLSASTQTLLVGSEHIQVYTGSVAGQIVKMPDATTLTAGFQYLLCNDASVNISVQDNAAGALVLLAPAQRLSIICTGTGSAAGTWSYVILQKSPQGQQFSFTYPGTGLAVNYTGGNYRNNGVLTAVAAGSITLPVSTTGTIYVGTGGVVAASASLPDGATPLYSFTTSASAVTSLTDVREEFENNETWGVLSDINGMVANQSKSAGTLEKYARADHTHGNSDRLVKAGRIAAGSFAGNPKKATVTFATVFPSAAYTISLIGADGRTFIYETKAAGSFVINSQANAALTGEVHWQAIQDGESV